MQIVVSNFLDINKGKTINNWSAVLLDKSENHNFFGYGFMLGLLTTFCQLGGG